MAGDRAGALATLDPLTVLQRYAAGEMISDIATDLGVHHTSLYRDLIRDCPDEWVAHQAARSLAAYEQAVHELDTLNLNEIDPKMASAACTLAHVRVKSRQWELERLLKRLYGPAMALTGADGGPLTVQIVRFSGNVIEGSAEQTTEQHTQVVDK